MVYQLPLHYLLGLEGVALLRTFAGEYDREFGEARVAEIRRLLESPALADVAVNAGTVDTVAGYRLWSQTYDEPGNGLFPFEEPFVHEIVDALPVGIALDAACGTGRHAAYLAARGHQVIGVDSSPDMLAHARAKVPDGEFHQGELHRLPLPDDHVDLVVCGLALSHLPDLKPPFAEFARVVRPGGHLVVTDIHHEMVALGSTPHVRSHAGEPLLIPSYRHRASDFLDAALPTGLELRRLDEPRHPGGHADDEPTAAEPTPQEWDVWPWSLHGITPAACAAVWTGTPVTTLWHFRLGDG